MKINSRVGAVLSVDDKHVNLLGYGVYIGDLRCSISIASINPCILLDNGRYVWGCQCWWGEEERMKEEIESWLNGSVKRTINEVEVENVPPTKD